MKKKILKVLDENKHIVFIPISKIVSLEYNKEENKSYIYISKLNEPIVVDDNVFKFIREIWQ